MVDRLGSALRLHGGGNPSILDREIFCLHAAGVFLKLRSWVSPIIDGETEALDGTCIIIEFIED